MTKKTMDGRPIPSAAALLESAKALTQEEWERLVILIDYDYDCCESKVSKSILDKVMRGSS